MGQGVAARIEYIDYSRVGAWTPEFRFRVEQNRAREFAAATNDLNPRHVNGENAPPLFAIVANREAVICAHALAMSRGNPPPFQRLHGEHDMFFDQQLRSGMVVWSKAALVGVRVKTSGTTLVFEENTRDDAGGMVNRQFRVIFLPGILAPRDAGIDAPDFRVPQALTSSSPEQTVVLHVDRDQTYRYAAASGDWSRFHLDDAFAKSVGAPGIVLHGLCTMAFMARAVVDACCAGDPTRLKRLALRFSRPVIPGDDLTVRIQRSRDDAQPQTYAFEARSSSGETVVRYGRADVSY
jgi:acyl dehydratase